MRRFIITVALLFAMSLFSKAQYLNKIHDLTNSSDWGYTVSVEGSNSYTIFGGGKNAKLNFNFLRTDTAGIELANKIVLSSNSYDHFRGNPGAIRRMLNGQYIVPITLSRPNGTAYFNFAGLAKVGSNGDSIWMKLLTDTMQSKNEFANDCNLMPGGGFVSAFSRNGIIGDAVLRRTDSNANVLWTIVHGADGFYTCEYIGDGKILVGAMWTRLKWIGSFHYYPSQPRFMIYDTSGNLLKDTLYDTRFAGGGRIYKDKNGGYFHWGRLDSLIYPNNPGDVKNFPEYIARLNDSFQIIWLKHFATLKFEKRWIWNVKQLTDGNYLVVGNRADTSFKPAPVGQGWAMKLDKNGFVMWDNHYFNDSATGFNYLIDAAERPDGSIVMTGTVGSTSQHTQEVWVVVVDSMGCIIPNCAPTSVPSVTQSQTELSIYPNPTNGSFTVKTNEVGTLTIANLQGQQVMTAFIKQGANQLVLKDVAAGVYVVTFRACSGRVVKHKLSYQLQ